MAICREKRGNSVYLAEYKNVRVNGKVKHIYVKGLGVEGPDGKPIRKPKRVLDNVDISGTRRYGDVAVMWELAEFLHFPDIIDRITPSNSDVSTGKILTMWAVNRAISPESATGLQQWARRTALADLAEVSVDKLNKDRIYRALDEVCYSDDNNEDIYDHTLAIEKRLFRQNGILDTDTLAYDLTSTYFYGTSCAMARKGYSRDKKYGRLQIVIALAVSRKDHLPIVHKVYPGNTQDSTTTIEFLSTARGFGIKDATIIWDRILTTENTVRLAGDNGYHVIAGLPATRDDVKDALKKAGDIEELDHFMKKNGHGSLYAKSLDVEIFGEPHSVVVCLNTDMRENSRGDRHEELLEIKDKLTELAEEKETWPEKKLHKAISKIVGGNKDLVQARVKRKGVAPRIEVRIRKQTIRDQELREGRYAILHTDPKLTARQVVGEYHGKDFIEKAFMSLKQDVAIRPIRHRTPSRIKSYVFVCVLGYYLRALLASRLKEKRPDASFDDFLEDLADVQRTTLTYGRSKSVRYLNLPTKTRDTLRAMKLSSRFRQVNTIEAPSL
jgi:transposase